MPGARQLAGPSGADRIPQWAQRRPQMARTKATGRNARKARSMLDATERSASIHHRADSVSTACLGNSIPRSRALVRISSFVGDEPTSRFYQPPRGNPTATGGCLPRCGRPLFNNRWFDKTQCFPSSNRLVRTVCFVVWELAGETTRLYDSLPSPQHPPRSP